VVARWGWDRRPTCEVQDAFDVRELMLAIALVAIFVGSFINCQIVKNAMWTTQHLASAQVRLPNSCYPLTITAAHRAPSI
jgi:hypothetical protein